MMPAAVMMRDGATCFGGEFRVDPAVLARETQTVSRSEGNGCRRHGVAAGAFDDIGAVPPRAESHQSRLRLAGGSTRGAT